MAKIPATPVKSSKPVTPVARAIPREEATRHAANTDDSAFDRAYQRYQQAQAEFLAFMGTPGWKRTLVAFVSGLLIALGLGYMASAVLGWMMVGAVMAGTSLFLSMLLCVLGAIAAAYIAGKAAARVTGAILTGEADERAIAAYDATRSFVGKLSPMRFFASKSVMPVAA